MEMKHNSAIKQLMREINTQMALKEKELDAAVKETIGEAQITQHVNRSGPKFQYITIYFCFRQLPWKIINYVIMTNIIITGFGCNNSWKY